MFRLLLFASLLSCSLYSMERPLAPLKTIRENVKNVSLLFITLDRLYDEKKPIPEACYPLLMPEIREHIIECLYDELYAHDKNTVQYDLCRLGLIQYGPLLERSIKKTGLVRDEHTNTLIDTICWKSDNTTMDIVLKNMPNLDLNATNVFGNTYLHIAAITGNTALTKTLLSKGARVTHNHFGMTPGDIAKKNCNSEIVALLDQHPLATINLPIDDTFKKIIVTFLEESHTISSIDIYGAVCKTAAIGCNWLLLASQYGVNIGNPHPQNKQTILHKQDLVFCNSREDLDFYLKIQSKILKFIVHHPMINVNQQSLSGWTALHDAARLNNTPMIEELLKHPEIDVNVPEKHFNETPLHIAAYNKHMSALRMLLKHPKINRGLRNSIKETALDIALKDSNPQIANLFK
jgi:ankyrin repeat protein